MGTVLRYIGSEPCTSDKAALKQARDVLLAAKPKWLSMEYGVIEKIATGDLAASLYWNGAAFRARVKNPDVHYGYPVEGYSLWMDSAAVLSEAKNVENAKLFMNFIMVPENAALISNFARYANGVVGSEKFMDPAMTSAPEIVMPANAPAPDFVPPCEQDVVELYNKIWTRLKQ